MFGATQFFAPSMPGGAAVAKALPDLVDVNLLRLLP
jgi:hypothetical protein